MDDVFRLLAFCIIVIPLIVVAYTPWGAARREMVYFEDCRGLFAAVIITATIALAYWHLGHLEAFVLESPEMMVVATTISLEVAYGYLSEKAVSLTARIWTTMFALVFMCLGAWRVYAAIVSEFGPKESPNAWILGIQAVIWIGAFVVAFVAKIRAKRAERKERFERAASTRAQTQPNQSIAGQVSTVPAPASGTVKQP